MIDELRCMCWLGFLKAAKAGRVHREGDWQKCGRGGGDAMTALFPTEPVNRGPTKVKSTSEKRESPAYSRDPHVRTCNKNRVEEGSTPVGFEPTRGDPIGLAGRRLSHSAKVSDAHPVHVQVN